MARWGMARQGKGSVTRAPQHPVQRPFQCGLVSIHRSRVKKSLYEGIMSNEKHERLLRRRDVLELCGFSNSTLKARMKQGRFPAPVEIGPQSFRWRLSDVQWWIHSRPLRTPPTRS